MEKEFVPYELAVKLKELGFNTSVLAWDNGHGDIRYENNYNYRNYTELPLWQQSFDWFRDKYGLYLLEDHRCCCTRDINNIQYWLGIKRILLAPYGSKVEKGLIEMGCFKTYYDGRLSCLEKLIEIVQNDNINIQK